MNIGWWGTQTGVTKSLHHRTGGSQFLSVSFFCPLFASGPDAAALGSGQCGGRHAPEHLRRPGETIHHAGISS